MPRILFDESGERRTVAGLQLRDGRTLSTGAVVVTTGTFLNGLAHVGEQKYTCGRHRRSVIQSPGRPTPDSRACLDAAEDRYAAPSRWPDDRLVGFRTQAGDAEPTPFSFMTERIEGQQVNCHIATLPKRPPRSFGSSIQRSPLYSGQIEGVGPRYCPSIEDKFVKFPDKPRHQIFLEPEGLDTNEVYVNGMSTEYARRCSRGHGGDASRGLSRLR